MDKVRSKGVKQSKGSKKEAPAKVVREAKLRPKGKANKALGKGRGALGGKKDKLSNDFST